MRKFATLCDRERSRIEQQPAFLFSPWDRKKERASNRQVRMMVVYLFVFVLKLFPVRAHRFGPVDVAAVCYNRARALHHLPWVGRARAPLINSEINFR